MGNTSPKPKPKNNQLNFTDDDIRSRAYEIWCDRNGTGNSRNGKYNPEDDWNAAIESLNLERSRLKSINVYLWNPFNSSYNLTKKSTQNLLRAFTDREDRAFNLDVVKTLISVSSVIATIVAGIGLFTTYKENNERLITDRFSKSVEQLGNDKLEIRLGGIYSLERISKDSDKDYWTVMEVLTAFVREHTKVTPKTTEKQNTSLSQKIIQKNPSTQTSLDLEQDIPPIPTDIQAVMNVIHRRKDSVGDEKDKQLDLRGINIQGAHFDGVNLQNARLFRANLQEVYFNDNPNQPPNLQGAHLTYANLQGAWIRFANLKGADLNNANLEGAHLFGANLQGANLNDANLQGARLDSANLQGAHLESANLQWADLNSAKMQKAEYTDKSTSPERCKYFSKNYPCPTIFPPNFDPKAAGMVLIN